MDEAVACDNVMEVDLFCTETEVVRKSRIDPVLLQDARVLQNLLTSEESYLPTATYFTFQSEVKPFMRSEVASWMSAVRLKYKAFDFLLDTVKF